jgi:hypothetical protein
MKGRQPMGAEIVAIGTEILLGSLIDTNTPWLSQRLAALGVVVYRHTTVGDDKGCLVAVSLLLALIHPSAWNKNSRKFAFRGSRKVT